MSESQSVSRLELARDEVDRVFGEGYPAAHPQMVLAVMNTAATDWAARLIGGALEDIAAAWGTRVSPSTVSFFAFSRLRIVCNITPEISRDF